MVKPINPHTKSKQQGVVLVVSLVFLIALTAVAAALMQNTTTDMKMSGASEEKVVATQEAISAVDEVIFKQTVPGQTNAFAQALVNFPLDFFDADDVAITGTLSTTNKDGDITLATIDIANNEYELEPDCPHSRSASSTQVFTCNVLAIRVNRKYGRKGNSTVDVNSGIAQQLLR